MWRPVDWFRVTRAIPWNCQRDVDTRTTTGIVILVSTTFLPVRLAVNLVLAYLVAGLTLLFATVLRDVVHEPMFGPGIAGEWAVGMGTLLFGAPAVLMILVVIDYALKGRRRMRRAAVVASVTPSAITAVLIPFYPEIVAVTLWLLVTGLVFGAVALLPARPDRTTSSPR